MNKDSILSRKHDRRYSKEENWKRVYVPRPKNNYLLNYVRM